MKIAHTKNEVVQSVQVRGYALVRRLGLCCLLACAGISVAHAGRFGDRERDRQQGSSQSERGREYQRDDREREYQREYQRDANRREYNDREEQRRQAQDQNGQGNDTRRSGRLTPDERRDLRRQINEAGNELYPRTPRR